MAAPQQTGGVTAQFFEAFFPTAYSRLRTEWPAVWALVQPDWLVERCTERDWVLPLPAALARPLLPEGEGHLRLRNVELLPFQLAGLLVGLVGMRVLGRGARGAATHAYLRWALLFFAGMNASSILCHALAARGSGLFHATLLADVVLTGSSSLCLLLSQVAAAPTTAAGAQAAATRCWAIFAALLAAALANQRLQLPWVPEAMYLGTTALAAHATSHRLLWQWWQGQRRGQMPLLLLAGAALALLLLCLPLDALMCATVGPWLGTVPLLFMASDLGIASLVALAVAGEAAPDESALHARRKGD